LRRSALHSRFNLVSGVLQKPLILVAAAITSRPSDTSGHKTLKWGKLRWGVGGERAHDIYFASVKGAIIFLVGPVHDAGREGCAQLSRTLSWNCCKPPITMWS